MSTERQIGMGPGPIPVSKIRAYAGREFGFHPRGDEMDRFVHLIRRMDEEFLSPPATTPASRDIPVTDTHGVSLLFNRIETRKKKAKERKERKA